MLRLASVFTDHALFLHSAPLTVRGESDAATVTALILRAGEVLASAEGGVTGGRFCIDVMTPAASFDPCTLRVTAGSESVICEDILFGELWLAAGQSNMELPNLDHLEYEGLRPRFSAAGIRAYQPTPIPMDEPAYDAPDFMGEGAWSTPADKEFENASALASIFSAVLSETLGIPCGFLNVNRGATRIEAWLPFDAMTEELTEYQKRIGRYPTKENWNAFTEAEMFQYKNFNQLSACERRVAAPLYGVRVRGMLWFQGCSNVTVELEHHMYAKTLAVLRDAWQREYGVPGGEFPVLMSTIYPHVYGKETIAHGRFNQALVDLVRAEPDRYFLLTNNDLSPVWATHTKNHPVHGIHKYPLGERFARVALASVYRGEPRCDAPLLSGVERSGDRLILRFAEVRDTLSFRNGRVRGLYVAGADGKYLPAEAEVIAPDTLAVYHPAIAAPQEAAYAMVSNEIWVADLQANGMAVAPFLTAPRKTWGDIVIEARPWCDLTRDYDFQYRTSVDSYPRAIYKPLPGCGICFDDINALGERSLRIYAEGKSNHFGAAYDARFGARLDFVNYTALAASFYPVRGLTPSLVLTMQDGTERVIPAERVKDGPLPEWAEFRFTFGLPADAPAVARFAFSFEVAEGEAAGVNIDKIYLIP